MQKRQQLLSLNKTVSTETSYIGDTVTYQITIENSSPYILQKVTFIDPLLKGIELIPESLQANMDFEGDLQTGMIFSAQMERDDVIQISFQVTMCCLSENPVCNTATVKYTIFDEEFIEITNRVCVWVYAYNFEQEITDIIQSIALEEAALAAITNAEGAKIQKFVSMENLPTQTLLQLNGSVKELLEIVVMFESILRKKLALLEAKNCIE